MFLLSRVADPAAASRRRANYELLLARLADLVPEPFATVPEGASPFVFPIETGVRPRLLEELRSERIAAIAVWSHSHRLLPRSAFGYAESLRARLVGLPVHQELRPADVERVAEAVLRAVRLPG